MFFPEWGGQLSSPQETLVHRERDSARRKLACESKELGQHARKLIELLVRNASAELTTFYYYTILRVNLIGLEGELKQIAEDARIEDRNHFEALVPRIYDIQKYAI